MGNQYANNWDPNNYDPNGLKPLTTYYWRIDEKSTLRTLKGDVWSFKTWVEPDFIGWWKFDEGEGNIAYDSAGNNHGTIYGAQWTTGQINGALDFDGVDDYVEIADDDSLTPSSEITISFWIYNRGGQGAGIYKCADCPSEPSSPGNSRAYYIVINVLCEFFLTYKNNKTSLPMIKVN